MFLSIDYFLYYTSLKTILKLQKAMHYFENVIVPNNQKSNYLFISERMNGNVRWKMEHIIKMHQERGFDFLLQYIICDTEQRSGNLTFPKGVTDTGNTMW